MKEVFISYNRDDQEMVLEVVEGLKGRSVPVWIDVEKLRGGHDWMDAIEEHLSETPAFVYFQSANGPGRWAREELKAAVLAQKESRDLPVIPVKLPGFEGEFPLFVRSKTHIDMRRGITAAKLDDLAAAIPGIEPSIGSDPAPPVPRPHRQPGAEREALARLARHLTNDNVTFFLGSRASQRSSDETNPALALARRLLASLDLLDAERDWDASFVPPLDVAGSYYATRQGEPLLESEVVRFLTERDASDVPLLQRLTTLLAKLAERPAVRGRRRTEQLLISTSPDLAVERALLTAGLPFIRLVQHRAVPRLCVNEFYRVEPGESSVRLAGPGERMTEVPLAELDDRMVNIGYQEVTRQTELSLHLAEIRGDGPLLLLYKFLGSQDLKNSCALSTEQHLRFMSRLLLERAYPKKVEEILELAPIVLLGTGLLDPDFRLAYFTLLQPALGTTRGMNYALLPRPCVATGSPNVVIENGLWDHLKDGARSLDIGLLELAGDHFLRDLDQELSQRLAG